MTNQSNPLVQSVHSQLLNYAHRTKENFNLVLSRYASERFLYRLSKTPYADRFVLKGASLFMLWMKKFHRPTQDIDLLGFGKIDTEELRTIFSESCNVEVISDGLVFDPNTIVIEEIREEQLYLGLRVRIRGNLGTARLYIQIDVGTGDAVFPSPQIMDYPAILDFPSPQLKVYPKETVIAEKLDAIIEHGMRNSRMKDYFDIWLLGTEFDFDGRVLVTAIRETIKQRGRKCDKFPVGLTAEFTENPDKRKQWAAFINKQFGYSTLTLKDVVSTLQLFLAEPIEAIILNSDFNSTWIKNDKWYSSHEKR